MNEPIWTDKTEPTARGHRLSVERWSGYATISILTEVLNFGDKQKSPLILARVDVITGTSHSDMRRFLGHTLEFFQDEALVNLGHRVLDRIYSELTETATAKVQPPNPDAN